MLRLKIEECTKVMHKYFKSQEALSNLTRPNLSVPDPTLYPMGVWTAPSADELSAGVSFGFKSHSNCLHFTLSHYPACCGIRMFHTFKVHSRLSQEFVDEFMAAFIEENRKGKNPNQPLGASERIEVIMVEPRAPFEARPDAAEEVVPVADPCIEYKSLWLFFHKYAKKVNTRLMRNSNTGNILHNMEVVF